TYLHVPWGGRHLAGCHVQPSDEGWLHGQCGATQAKAAGSGLSSGAQPLWENTEMKLTTYLAAAALLVGTSLAGGLVPAAAQEQAKPNILVIMADDIGYWNISAYNRGMLGYRTPNIDRIANEGALFTDYYGQQSCTAGRSAFITGQTPMRTGLLKVGLPGAKEGLSDKDPTLADLLKPLGYVSGQFGKNHLGDRNE